MSKSNIQQLADYGQSIWLDYISRRLLTTGKLEEFIRLGVMGMTSNPTIFDQAISMSEDYDEHIVQLAGQGKSTFEIYDDLTVCDIRSAADLLRGVYEQTGARDGYVSLEIDPRLANNKEASIKEGLRLFEKVDRPNLMIKVPATSAGFSVVEELLAQGVNVNVTLIFSLEQYQRTVQAYFEGMARRLKRDPDLRKIHSVASVFVSRVDTAVDGLLADKIKEKKDEVAIVLYESLLGKAAIANSRLIFAESAKLFLCETFRRLARNGASPQRVLWASTGTKNPQYSDIKYVEELIARPTVNTIPEKTLNAFLDHGSAQEALTSDAADARKVISLLKKEGIDVDEVCVQLLSKGLIAFEKSFDSLFKAIDQKVQKLCVQT